VRLRALAGEYAEVLEAKPHTAVYRMHKYFARRPWNVFSDLITRYSSPGEIVLDPFCGGGVTAVEGLKLGRKIVAVDVNPVATYVTCMECAPAYLAELRSTFNELQLHVSNELSALYHSRCNDCGSRGIADWFEWDEKTKRISRVRLDCPNCGSKEQKARRKDQMLAEKIERNFENEIKKRGLWFPETQIPYGDKTKALPPQGIVGFHQLFTKRNLLALAILRKEILKGKNEAANNLLTFAFSSSLKWTSRLSHLRGKIVEGWAMHAYWIYPRSLELNVWNVFKRRFDAVYRGKQYSNQHIGSFCRFADRFEGLLHGESTCLILNRSATDLPFPAESVDAVVTDPPYGANVNYAELCDFWNIWMDDGRTIDKKNEVVINRTQHKSIEDYERLLELVFRECFRVLKPTGRFVSTFNSKDFRVVASFVLAASHAGFTLPPDGARYQAPIRSYTTTFHAMQIGALVGDFVFAFTKTSPREQSTFDKGEQDKIQAQILDLVGEIVRSGRPERHLREQAYGMLLPFLAKYAIKAPAECRHTADFFERKIKENDDYFKRTRNELIETRKRTYGKTKG
jgi:SAM-dependent methyltransferase